MTRTQVEAVNFLGYYFLCISLGFDLEFEVLLSGVHNEKTVNLLGVDLPASVTLQLVEYYLSNGKSLQDINLAIEALKEVPRQGGEDVANYIVRLKSLQIKEERGVDKADVKRAIYVLMNYFSNREIGGMDDSRMDAFIRLAQSTLSREQGIVLQRLLKQAGLNGEIDLVHSALDFLLAVPHKGTWNEFVGAVREKINQEF